MGNLKEVNILCLVETHLRDLSKYTVEAEPTDLYNPNWA